MGPNKLMEGVAQGVRKPHSSCHLPEVSDTSNTFVESGLLQGPIA